MSNTPPAKLMAKANRACQSARVLLDVGDMDGACNRAYYAMSDAARAALLAAGAPVQSEVIKTHSGLLNSSSEHLVKNDVSIMVIARPDPISEDAGDPMRG